MELIIAALVIWAIVHFVLKAQKKEKERQDAEQREQNRQRQEAEQRERERQRQETEERERPAREARERLEAQQRREREAVARQAAAEEHARRVAAIAAYSPDRLRFEYSKREKAISELKADIREENRQHDEFLATHPDHMHDRAYVAHGEFLSEFEAKIRELRSEMALFEAAM